MDENVRGAVEVRRLVKWYGSYKALDEITFDVHEGEFVTLLGPSGCGKTTSLRCIAGLEEVDEGSVRIGGQVVATAQEFVPPNKRDIGMVFQSYAVWPHMTVYENLAYGLRLRRRRSSEIQARVQGVLEMVGLEGLEKRYPSQLSGGQQQRVAIGRSLIIEPRLLLFDEPLSNLDAKLRERMRFEIRDLQKRLKKTSIYVTHDQSEAMVISDRVIIMDKGRIVQMGTPRSIYDRPANEFVAGFFGTINILAGIVVASNTECTKVAIGAAFEVDAPATSLPLGAKVSVVIRPERVRIIDEASPLSRRNTWPAHVERDVFLGGVVDLYMQVNDCSMRARADSSSIRNGVGSVFVHVDPGDVYVIPQDQTPTDEKKDELP